MREGKKIAFGVDSFENYKMWYEENFIELSDLLQAFKQDFALFAPLTFAIT